MHYIPEDYYLSTLQKNEIKQLLSSFILDIYDHFDFINFTQKDYLEELGVLYAEDTNYFSNSVYYVLRDHKKNNIHASIRTTLRDRNCTLPIEKLFGIKIDRLPFIETQNIWHVGRFFISNKIPGNRIKLLKKMLFNAFYPIASIGNSILFAECDAKLIYTLRKFGINVETLGSSIEYICSETFPICIQDDTLMSFIKKNQTYFEEENEKDVDLFLAIKSFII
ncbi:hypothetical protein ACFSPU_01445 [Haoranjiania flava]|uniref:Uncharacterized protein n=1 Tax=Haoranjiania flava TaxID=1856322 RepID=A0AAE3IJK1_9BACT|nr:hypothetical protein [Haoranjiania flava]MCU7692899.1 hypothetical protein [Haoranjiania flava]